MIRLHLLLVLVLLLLLLGFMVRHLFSLLLLLEYHLIRHLRRRWAAWLTTDMLLGWVRAGGSCCYGVVGLRWLAARIRPAAYICLFLDILGMLWPCRAVAPWQRLLSISRVRRTRQIRFFLCGRNLLLALRILAFTKNGSLEILEGYHYDGHIIKTLPIQRILQYGLNGQSTLLMHALRWPIIGILLPFVPIAAVPDTLGHVLVWHFIKDAVWGQQYEIVVFVYLKLPDFRLGLDNIYVSTSICQFGLGVTECAWYGQATWKYSDGADDEFWILVLWRIFNWLGGSGLVNLATCLYNPIVLSHIWRLMVSTQRHYDLSSIYGNYGSAVADVGAVAGIAYYQDYNGAAAAPINDYRRAPVVSALAHIQKRLFSFFEAADDGFLRVHRKTVLLYNEVVELVSQELGAGVPAMAVVDTKKGAFWPIFFFPMRRFGNIDNNGNSIFIIVSDKTLIGYGRIGSHDTISLNGAFRWLFIRNNDSCPRLQSQFLRLLLFVSRDLMDHLLDV